MPRAGSRVWPSTSGPTWWESLRSTLCGSIPDEVRSSGTIGTNGAARSNCTTGMPSSLRWRCRGTWYGPLRTPLAWLRAAQSLCQRCIHRYPAGLLHRHPRVFRHGKSLSARRHTARSTRSRCRSGRAWPSWILDHKAVRTESQAGMCDDRHSCDARQTCGSTDSALLQRVQEVRNLLPVRIHAFRRSSRGQWDPQMEAGR